MPKAEISPEQVEKLYQFIKSQPEDKATKVTLGIDTGDLAGILLLSDELEVPVLPKVSVAVKGKLQLELYESSIMPEGGNLSCSDNYARELGKAGIVEFPKTQKKK